MLFGTSVHKSYQPQPNSPTETADHQNQEAFETRWWLFKMCKETIQLTQHLWRCIHVGARILELASKHKVMILEFIYQCVDFIWPHPMLNCTFGVRFLELYFSYPITKHKTYLLKRTKQVDWKTIGRLEDELNKFLSWWHPFQVSGGLWLRFRWNWPQPRGSRRPARARPERAAWCEEPDGDLSIRYTYIYIIYIYIF